MVLEEFGCRDKKKDKKHHCLLVLPPEQQGFEGWYNTTLLWVDHTNLSSHDVCGCCLDNHRGLFLGPWFVANILDWLQDWWIDREKWNFSYFLRCMHESNGIPLNLRVSLSPQDRQYLRSDVRQHVRYPVPCPPTRRTAALS